ncbi:MAG: hypothetical protein M9921_01925 [Fimbriimonadaceae bacterium]|nr:hypothetical protein [Chthonomonadaceae bacterium]MCO5295595.1 hypothetical protein [Fimbriimonadaceae bacterium]
MMIALIFGAAFLGQQVPDDPPLLRKEANLTCADWANVANHYIAIGERKAVEELLDRTSDKPSRFAISNAHAARLCRLLYMPHPGNELRGPRVYDSWLPDGSTALDRWPEFPFAEQDGVWFWVGSRSPAGTTGTEEPVGDYVRYCEAHGVFRSQPLMVPSTAQAMKALEALLKSDRWDPKYGQRWKASAWFLRGQTEY